MSPTRPPLSVLDLSTVREGGTSAEALAGTTTLARRADELGYRRFWVAEHHNMPAVASTTPPVLIAHLAALTRAIRVGSGGVMLPNHAPLVVGEQFAMLEALHPGRIDLGLGRAPGTDPRTASALRRSPDALGAEDFPQHLLDLLGLLGDDRGKDGLARHFSATPAPDRAGVADGVAAPAVWLLGSSGFSAQLAGELGLPFCFAHHFGGQNTATALAMYRRAFTPSATLAAPHAMVSVSVVTEPTAEEAEHLAGPSRVMGLSLRMNRLAPIVSPDRAAAVLRGVDAGLLQGLPATQVLGTPDTVVAELADLAARTDADELMLTGTTYDVATRLGTLEDVAARWAPAGP